MTTFDIVMTIVIWELIKFLFIAIVNDKSDQ